MCNPAAAMMAVTAVTTAYGQQQQGRFQSRVAKNNAMTQERLAEDALDRGQRAEEAHRLKVAQMKSAQKAKMSASGLDITTGAPSELISDTAMMGELDALTIRDNAEREAFGHGFAATNSLNQGALDRATANNRATGTIMTAATEVGSQWYASKSPLAA